MIDTGKKIVPDFLDLIIDIVLKHAYSYDRRIECDRKKTRDELSEEIKNWVHKVIGAKY